MRPGIDPKVDYAFKRVFGSESNRDVLVDLLNAVLQFGPGREVVEVEILNPFNEKEFAGDKLSIVDVKARDTTGRVFAVEMQMIGRPDHRQRVLYYAARLYSQQLVKGDDYAVLRPAFVISFVDSRVFPESSAFHTRFVMHDVTTGLTFSDDLALHIIELPKFLTASAALGGRFEAWCYFLRHADVLDTDALPEPLDVPPIRKAMETLAVISEIERERERYESRWKRKLDETSYRNEALRNAKINYDQTLALAERCRLSAERAADRAAQTAYPEVREILLARRDEDLAQCKELLESAEHSMLLTRVYLALRDRDQMTETFDQLAAKSLQELRELAARLNIELSKDAP